MQTRLDLDHHAANPAGTLDTDYRDLRRAVVLVQRAELERLHDHGEASETSRRKIERQLDLEDARYDQEI